MEIALDQLKEKKPKPNADERKVELGRSYLNGLPNHKRLALTATAALIQYSNPVLRPQALKDLKTVCNKAEIDRIFELVLSELVWRYPNWSLEFVTEKINESKTL